MKYTRNCPKCEGVIEYKSKYNRKYAENDGRLCKSCMLKGRSQKDLYGEGYDEIIEKRSNSLKKVDHWWHDKIAESRRKNGTYELTEKHKKKISEATVFSETGKNHVRVKKILKEYNITYDEYLSRMDDYSRYKREVMNLTKRLDVSSLENFEKRGKAGIYGAYHLDHKVEISEGYINGMAPKEIAKIENLQFIPWEENLKKRKYPNGIHDKKIKDYYGKS